VARDLTVRRSFEPDALSSPVSGKCGQKGWSLLLSPLQDTVLRLIKKPTLRINDCSMGKPRIFTLAEAFVYKECFGPTFSATATANFDTTPSVAADRERECCQKFNEHGNFKPFEIPVFQ